MASSVPLHVRWPLEALEGLDAARGSLPRGTFVKGVVGAVVAAREEFGGVPLRLVPADWSFPEEAPAVELPTRRPQVVAGFFDEVRARYADWPDPNEGVPVALRPGRRVLMDRPVDPG